MYVHMAWLGSKPPPHAIKLASKLAADNPADTVVLHTDGSQVLPEWRPVYEAAAFSPRMQSDILRHALLFRHGGLWLDVDVTPLVPLAELVAGLTTYSAFLLRPRYWIGTDIIYSPPGWSGWHAVNKYISSRSIELPVSGLLFAHDMIAALIRGGQNVHLVDDQARFPCDADHVTDVTMALRCGLKPGLGDMVADGLAAVGITKDRVQAVASKVGIKDCGCAKRQAALNRVGQALGLPPRRAS